MTIREIRENQGLTPTQLAAKANVSAQTVYRIERGDPVGRVYIARVCNALGVKMEDVSGLNFRD